MKAGYPLPPETKQAIFSTWLESNGEKTFKEIGDEFRLSVELVEHYIKEPFAKRFPKLIEFFGETRMYI